jgi:hypothetical protein
MSKIADRLYALEAEQHPRQRLSMRWRMSPDALEACATEAGIAYRSLVAERTMILGYPVVVDTSLLPDTIVAESERKPMTTGFAPVIPELDWLAGLTDKVLGDAWDEAEGALPEGWRLVLTRQSEVSYMAEAVRLLWGVPQEVEQGASDTPAGALAALSTRLRSR